MYAQKSAIAAQVAGEYFGAGFAIPLAGREKTTPLVLKDKEMP
jgi:hypothetical protein